MSERVLVIGKGGREHALAWKLAQSPLVGQVYCAPGNPGTALEGQNVPLETTDCTGLVDFAKRERIRLTVVGPEDPLAAGIVDAFQDAGLTVFGPTKAAAQIEASKVFAKELMRDADVPTAEFRTFDHPTPAKTWIESRNFPVVVKADGLAAGKGVFVCKSTGEAIDAVNRIMVKEEFGPIAGRRIVVEKRLEGREASLLALVSGRTILTLPPAKDYKPAFDGDTGPNTGGMGTLCPATHLSPDLLAKIEATILVPTVHAMKRGGWRRERCPFRGVLFAGLMLTNQGPRVLEFNCRFGDPETQVILMRLQSDLYELLLAVAEERLNTMPMPEWDARPAVCVVLASEGYPGKYPRDRVISGLDEAAKLSDVKVFHAGTRQERDRILTDGGRVLAVTALGETQQAARERAYHAASLIQFTGKQFRTDIGA